MKVVQKGEFPGTRAELEAALDSYRQALEAHKGTVGVPAPWPAYPVLRELVRLPADRWALQSEMVDDPEGEPRLKPSAPPEPAGTTVAQLRGEVAAMRQALIDAGVWQA